MFCTECGTKVEFGSRFCVNCGCRISYPHHKQIHLTLPDFNKKKKIPGRSVNQKVDLLHNTGVRCLIAVSIIACIAFISLALFRRPAAAKAPDDETVRNELTRSLFDYIDFLQLRDYTVRWSQSDSNSFSAEYDVKATSMYTEYRLLANTIFSKYDQGWKLDSCEWENKGYEVTNWPDENELAHLKEERAKEISDDLLDVDYTNFSNDGVKDFYASGFIDTIYDDFVGLTGKVTSIWRYNQNTDRFFFVEDETQDIQIIPFETEKIEGTCIDDLMKTDIATNSLNYIRIADVTGNSLVLESTALDIKDRFDLVTTYSDLMTEISEYEEEKRLNGHGTLILRYECRKGNKTLLCNISRGDDLSYTCSVGYKNGFSTFHYGTLWPRTDMSFSGAVNTLESSPNGIASNTDKATESTAHHEESNIVQKTETRSTDTVMVSDRLLPTDIRGSSEVIPYEDNGTLYSYYASYVNDDDLTTAWQEGDGTNSLGIGEYIDIFVPKGTVITKVEIWPGYLKSEEAFHNNSAVSRLVMSTNSRSLNLDCSNLTTDYEMALRGKTFNFEEINLISDGIVRFEIEDARYGEQWQDTSISELHLFGYTQ